MYILVVHAFVSPISSAHQHQTKPGNYYSLKSQHQRAVAYFDRALKLNGKFVAAWTLAGHEYLEMKNTSGAIDAYRRAIGTCGAVLRKGIL